MQMATQSSDLLSHGRVDWAVGEPLSVPERRANTHHCGRVLASHELPDRTTDGHNPAEPRRG